MRSILFILVAIGVATSEKLVAKNRKSKLSCRTMLEMPEFLNNDTIDLDAVLLSYNSNQNNKYVLIEELNNDQASRNDFDSSRSGLIYQNQPSQITKKLRNRKDADQTINTSFLTMKTTADPKDQIPKNDVKERLIDADEEIKQEFAVCQADLHEAAIQNAADFNSSLQNLTEAIHYACVKMEKEIKHYLDKKSDIQIQMIKNATAEIASKLKDIGDVVDEAVENNIRLRILWLSASIEQKTRELAEVQAITDKLEAEIPPAESICQMYLECSMCLANPKCGWCSRENFCVEGDEIAPLHFVCLQYDNEICRGESCSMNTDCEACISNELCGWCDSKKSCLERVPTFEGCPDSWYNQAGPKKMCPAAVLTQEEIESTQALKEKVELRRADVEAEIDKFTPQQKQNREKRAELIKYQQKVMNLRVKIEQNQKELDHLTDLMAEYEACVELVVKRHNRMVRYYRKKHEAELAAEMSSSAEGVNDQAQINA